MSNVFFTSDLHIGHRFVAGLRGFEDDLEGHTDAVIDGWNSVVREGDQVWVLGDLTCSNGAIPAALEIIKSLPGEKHFIAGNHDPVHSLHRQAHKWQARYLEAFQSVQTFAKRKVEGEQVLLSHFPYHEDTEGRYEIRYTQFRLPDEGLVLIHGHTHSDKKVTSPRELHVGVDAWNFKPVPLSIVEAFVRGEQID